ncbi:DoxX family protein [Streptomyces sp. 135]|uniref:DoxX family protein n=1 Tax=Streptomyces sp. 135 TaxID=2838850 RepID=UPI001CC0CF86|nr:DoxX family protein [Streptomyces sp. 135]
MTATATTAAATTPVPVTAPRSRGARIALRTLRVLLAVFFGVASGVPKLIAHPTAVESFDKLGWGAPGMYTIGALELLGGIALLLPLLSSLAATAFIGLMAGAFIVTVTALGGENAATPLILTVPLAWIAWATRGETAKLIARIRR